MFANLCILPYQLESKPRSMYGIDHLDIKLALKVDKLSPKDNRKHLLCTDHSSMLRFLKDMY